jgi:hypothetical protein
MTATVSKAVADKQAVQSQPCLQFTPVAATRTGLIGAARAAQTRRVWCVIRECRHRVCGNHCVKSGYQSVELGRHRSRK